MNINISLPPQGRTFRDDLILLLMPVLLAVTLLYLRMGAGPFWNWNLVDPSYFYLFDTLNLLNLQNPGHLAHPGVPVYTLGAVLLKILNPLVPIDQLTAQVIKSPEGYLRDISSLFIAINCAVLWIAGLVAYRTFNSYPAALAIQLAPFLSKLILKRGFLVTPETLLISATLLLVIVALLSLREGELENRRNKYAILFGLAAGFGVAIKLTAAPIFLLPLFILAQPRAILVYALVSGVSLVLFVAPALGAFDIFMSFVDETIFSNTSPSQDHGSSFGNLAVVLNILKRPVLNVSLLLSIICITMSIRKAGVLQTLGSVKMRTITGIATAQLVQAVLVAKQPNAYYMIPSFMLSPLGVILCVRYLAAFVPFDRYRYASRNVVGIALFVVMVIAQFPSIHKLDRELTTLNQKASQANIETFSHCARIYHYPASTQVFALFLADRVTGYKFTDKLKGVSESNDFWIEDWAMKEAQIRNWAGEIDGNQIVANYPCLYFRGKRLGRVEEFLRNFAPDAPPTKNCSTKNEKIITVGVDCQGNLIK